MQRSLASPPVVSTKPQPSKREPAGPEITFAGHEERAQIDASVFNPVGRSSDAQHCEHLWLVGVLERGNEAGTWALRYARAEENDRYGGRLQLVAPQPICGYRIGQLLRVEGHVVRDAYQAVYQVERIEALPQH